MKITIILHIRFGVGSKFALQQTVLTLEQISKIKKNFRSKAGKIEHHD